MNEIRIRATITDKPSDRCPYCGMKDRKPETHLSEDRCHPPERWSSPRATKRWDEF